MSENNVNWGKYRLGDFFHLPEGKKRHERFARTVINRYYTRTSESSNYKVLNDVIDEVQALRKIEIPRNDCCVMHLRTGDIINNSEFTIDQFFTKKRYFQRDPKNGKYIKAEWNNYVKNQKYYTRVIKRLKGLRIDNISFSYNLDFNPFADSETSGRYQCNKNNDKSLEYVQRIKSLFSKNSFNVINYECQDVDHDFIYMCNSRFFVPSGGSLSKTIARIVELKHNIVVTNK